MATQRVDSLRISDEALKLLREEGLDAVSFRRIAAAIGVGASTLYWHIRDKDALLGSLALRIFRDCLDAVGEQDSWQNWLRAFGLALWQAQVDIPDVRKLIVVLRPDPERQKATRTEITELLRQLGLAEETSVIAQRSVQALVTGWTTLAAGGPRATSDERGQFKQALDALIAGWEPLRSRSAG